MSKSASQENERLRSWQSQRFPGFEVDFNRDILLDPIELLITHDRVQLLLQPTFELYRNASTIEQIVSWHQVALLHNTVIGLSETLPIWAREAWKLRRAEWAQRER